MKHKVRPSLKTRYTSRDTSGALHARIILTGKAITARVVENACALVGSRAAPGREKDLGRSEHE